MDCLANSIHAPKLEGAAHKFADIVTMYTNANAHLTSEIIYLVADQVHDREIARLTRASATPTSRSIDNIR